jgi:hypothetical protein
MPFAWALQAQRQWLLFWVKPIFMCTMAACTNGTLQRLSLSLAQQAFTLLASMVHPLCTTNAKHGYPTSLFADPNL